MKQTSIPCTEALITPTLGYFFYVYTFHQQYIIHQYYQYYLHCLFIIWYHLTSMKTKFLLLFTVFFIQLDNLAKKMQKAYFSTSGKCSAHISFSPF